MPSCKDGNGGHREVFDSLNDRKVQGQLHVLRAERRRDCKIEALTVSIFSDDLIERATPVIRRVIPPVFLNVVAYVTINFWSGTGSLGATLKWFQKEIIDHGLQSLTFDSKSKLQRQSHVPHYSNA